VQNDTLHDRIWRSFWYSHILHETNREIWQTTSPYSVRSVNLRVRQFDGLKEMQFWSGRSDSVKDKLVSRLNTGLISEDQAWVEFAKNVNDRAHSFREDIDSTLDHLGLLDIDGRPSFLAQRWLFECDRWGVHSPSALNFLRAVVLQEGGFGALLHYIHKLSEQRLRDNPLDFTSPQNPKTFERNLYVEWLAKELAENLRVLKRGSSRGGQQRKPLQAELSTLGNLGLIPPGKGIHRFRTGVGLVIHWANVQDAMLAKLDV
jgi:hypothetical protein